MGEWMADALDRALAENKALRSALAEVREKLMSDKPATHAIEDALVPLDHALAAAIGKTDGY